MKRTRTRIRATPEATTGSARVSMRGIRRRAWLIALSTVLGAAAATGVAAIQDSVYRAEALILVRPGTGDAGAGAEGQRRIDTEIQVIESDTVEQRAKVDLAVVRDLPDVHASSKAGSDIVALQIEAGDPHLAASLANAYARAYIAVSKEQAAEGLRASAEQVRTQLADVDRRLDDIAAEIDAAPARQQAAVERRLADERARLIDERTAARARLGELETDASVQTGGARLVSAAVAVRTPVAPRPIRAAGFGALLGLLLGLALAALADALDTSVHTPADVTAAADTPVLAVIPPFHSDGRRPVAFTRDDEQAAEAYRTLRAELQLATRHRRVRVLHVTAPTSGAGATTTAVNLAVHLALTGRRIALVEGDLRAPRLHQIFSTASKGLTAAMLGEAVIDCLHPVALPTGHLEVMPVGFVPSNPSETLGSPRFRAVIDEVASMFDMVVVDSSPVLASSDAMVLSSLADAVVVVAEAHRTSAAELHDSMAALDRAGAPVVGAVLTRGDAPR